MTHDLIDPKAHKQLFIDDHAIERLYAIERTLHQPDRKGAVLQRDRDMGQVRVAAWSVPIWNPEKDLWEWWYNGHYGETGRLLQPLRNFRRRDPLGQARPRPPRVAGVEEQQHRPRPVRQVRQARLPGRARPLPHTPRRP